METLKKNKKLYRNLGIVAVVYCILMLLATLWTVYGPLPGMSLSGTIELREGSELGLRHTRYFLSPHLSRASLNLEIKNLPPNLLDEGKKIICPYRILEKNESGKVLDGKECSAFHSN